MAKRITQLFTLCLLFFAGTARAQMSDTAMIRKNIMDNMHEIQLSQLGRDKGKSQLVKNTARMMIADHTLILNDLKKVGKKDGMQGLNMPMNTMDMSNMSDLNSATGAAFDKAWVSQMLTMHNAKLAELQGAVGTITDPDLKAAVNKAIPKIKRHRDTLARLNKMM